MLAPAWVLTGKALTSNKHGTVWDINGRTRRSGSVTSASGAYLGC